MTNDHNSRQSETRQILAHYRTAINDFPFRVRIALLHEIEQAETRQSAIESESALARVALRDNVTKASLSEIPTEMVVNLRQTDRSLRSNFSEFKKRLHESLRHWD